MRGLFKNVANELIQQLTPEDLKEIMDSTVETVLSNMTPDQRYEFSKEIINNAVTKMLAGFSDEQRVELLHALLPTMLGELRIGQLTADQLLTALNQAGKQP